MTKERVESIRKIVLPFIAKKLKEIDYEGLGESDAKEFTNDFNEILKLAEDAIEQDCISRQAVKDLMRSLTRWCVRSEDGRFNNVGLLYDDVMFGIDRLPSGSSSENPNKCEDAVSRQAVEKITWEEPSYTDPFNVLTEVREKVRALPPVTSQPKMGHWIETAEEYYKAINEKGGGVNENTPYFTDDIACSECLAKFSVIDNETERFICCPNCGAKMQEVEE